MDIQLSTLKAKKNDLESQIRALEETIKNIEAEMEQLFFVENPNEKSLSNTLTKLFNRKQYDQKIEIFNSTQTEIFELEQQKNELEKKKEFLNNKLVKIEDAIRQQKEEETFIAKYVEDFKKLTFEEAFDKIKSNDFASEIQNKILQQVFTQLLPTDEDKLKKLDELYTDETKILVINALSNDKSKIDALASTYETQRRTILSNPLIEDGLKCLALNLLNTDIDKALVIESMKSDQEKLEQLANVKDKTARYVIVKSLSDKYKIEHLSELLKDWKPQELRKMIKDPILLKQNIKKFMLLEGVSSDSIDTKMETLTKMFETNNEVMQNISFQLLEEKYVESLGEDKLNQITTDDAIQKRIIDLNTNEYSIFCKCIKFFTQKNDTQEWTVFAEEILNNISQYSDIIQNQELFTEEDLQSFSLIIQNQNIFNISTLEDLRNFSKIKLNKSDEIMKNSTNLEEKKEALLMKIFGHDLKFANRLIQIYGEDINVIKDGNIKYYIQSLQELLNLSDENLLHRIYNECEETTLIDKCGIERKIKNEYGKLYNESLLNIEDCEKIDGQENLYNAGTNFKMIVTAVGAYSADMSIFNEIEYTNYKESWNRPIMGTQHFCCSYIGNEMLETAVDHNSNCVFYGFDQMSEDSLMHQSSGLTDSNMHNSFNTTVLCEDFHSPANMLKNTTLKNELNYRRIQDGKKKQPSYIVVFKRNNKYLNMENAQKASQDWGGLPIVVIDEDECKSASLQKKLRNEVSLDELKENYTMVSPEERKTAFEKIRGTIYDITHQNNVTTQDEEQSIQDYRGV